MNLKWLRVTLVYLRQKFFSKRTLSLFLRGLIWAGIMWPVTWSLGFNFTWQLFVVLATSDLIHTVIFPDEKFQAIKKAVDTYNLHQAKRGYQLSRPLALVTEIQQILGKTTHDGS